MGEVIAHKFYKSKKTIETIKWASLLHDVGKIGIPEEILIKPGRLTDEEFKLIKQHPLYSKDILSNIFDKNVGLFNDEDFALISDIAKYHHERLDGKGYPCGLKGEEIPIIARIISVADSYEAITAERPYKKAMSAEWAKEELIKGVGTQFDPKVVEAFLECFEKIKEI